jgi:hypothetical protein
MRGQSLFACVLLLLTSCATISSTEIPYVKPLGGVRLDTSFALPNVTSAVTIDAGGGSVLIIGQNRDGAACHIARYGSDLKLSWQKQIALGANSEADMSGLHANEGTLYIPVQTSYPHDVKEYSVRSFDLATGDSLNTSTLLRLNSNDVGWYHGEFSSNGPLLGLHVVHPVWTPDGSKILLYKQYPSSSGRIAIEMMLYRRGYSLITKNNVDFRFDTLTQQLIGILPDNDGVAFIFIHNRADSSIEVGRFEILGSKKLSTVKYQLPSSSNIEGTIALAPRGHAYLISSHIAIGRSNIWVCDFDFYTGKVQTQELQSTSDSGIFSKHHDAPVLYVASDANRLVGSMPGNYPKALVALDLDLHHAWEYEDQKSVLSGWGYAYAIPWRIMNDAIGYLYGDGDTLRLFRVDLNTGRELAPAALAEIRGIDQQSLDHAIVLDKQVYFAADRLYRLTLP